MADKDGSDASPKAGASKSLNETELAWFIGDHRFESRRLRRDRGD
jgi:hypothetical protein